MVLCLDHSPSFLIFEIHSKSHQHHSNLDRNHSPYRLHLIAITGQIGFDNRQTDMREDIAHRPDLVRARGGICTWVEARWSRWEIRDCALTALVSQGWRQRPLVAPGRGRIERRPRTRDRMVQPTEPSVQTRPTAHLGRPLWERRRGSERTDFGTPWTHWRRDMSRAFLHCPLGRSRAVT